jgi:hypothetical protein
MHGEIARQCHPISLSQPAAKHAQAAQLERHIYPNMVFHRRRPDEQTRTARARVEPSLWKRPARDVSPLQAHYGIYGPRGCVTATVTVRLLAERGWGGGFGIKDTAPSPPPPARLDASFPNKSARFERIRRPLLRTGKRFEAAGEHPFAPG